MNRIFSVLKGPLKTEKVLKLRAGRKVVLQVALDANKIEIKEAAQKLFSTPVVDVRTSVVRGKTKRLGKSMGKQSNWKKAILTLGEGADLDVFGVVTQASDVQPEA